MMLFNTRCASQAVVLLAGAMAVCALLIDTPAAWAGDGTASRHIEVRGEWIYVDGEPFLVKGVGYSPYRPGQTPWGHTVSLALMGQDFTRIRSAGFNTIRTWAPLRDDALALAHEHGLMVLQGIWVDRNNDYASATFRQAMMEHIAREATRVTVHPNVLALVVGNELPPAAVYQAGIPETEALLRQASRTVKDVDADRLVSYANWPALAFLDATPWDLVSFNVYPYEPPSVAHSFGYRGYVEHLKRTVAARKPLIITEVGLSVSQAEGATPGYGGYTPAEQATELVALWDQLFQAGAQGGVIFEWNDEWWKQGDVNTDAAHHDPNDPEEWFGLVEFLSPEDVQGRPRPAYEALARYNQAIVLTPVSGRAYEDQIPLTVYTTASVASVRFQLGRPWWPGRWVHATYVSRHWWKGTMALSWFQRPGEHLLVVEALDAQGKVLVHQERVVLVGVPLRRAQVEVTTDRELYEVGAQVESLEYTVRVTDETQRPLADALVYLAVSEPQSHITVTQVKATDHEGTVRGTYLVRESGMVTISAATPMDPAYPLRRVGDEVMVIVRRQAQASHQPSPWERQLPETLRETLGQVLAHRTTAFTLHDPGSERVIDFSRYGEFKDVGTSQYHYEVSDWVALGSAAGDGVYPSESVLRNPAYQAALKAGTLDGSHWDFTFHKDPQIAFFRWATAEEEPGVKQFYTALTLERAGLWDHAVKAYYAVLVHFPTSIGWTGFDPPTPWYVGKVARDKIEAILRLHPELGLRLEDAQVTVRNGFDNDVDNDTIVVTPGRLVAIAPEDVNPPSVDLEAVPVTREVGTGRVRLVQYANGHWRLLVDDVPWTIRGLTYSPSAVGETPDEAPLKDWTKADRNANGTLDIFETFVDHNGNNRQDPDESTVGDFTLIDAMGVNTLRLFHTNHDPATAKPLLRQLYDQHGMMVMMGDFVGMYTVGSGATWEEGTDYLDPAQRERMLESVTRMVEEYKDEPYLLLWVLGNENNYGGVHGIVGGVGNAGQHPAAYYRFLNELATWIHAADPNHPVALGNGEVLFLDVIATQAPAFDIFGANVYRGWHGFGRSFFSEVARHLDKPVLITEYGCPAYQTGASRATAELDQALYHFRHWVDIADNLAGRGVGNAVGGVAFEWSDEWWKAGQPPRFSPTVQETQANWAGAFPGGWNFEEWFGLVSQGNGTASPFLRQLRTSYDVYRALWAPRSP